MNRYPAKTFNEAQRMRRVGLTGPQIADTLGVPIGTVYRWIDQRYQDTIAGRARHREEVNAIIARLRGLGLSNRSIMVVLAEYHDERVTLETVRRRCEKLGCVKGALAEASR